MMTALIGILAFVVLLTFFLPRLRDPMGGGMPTAFGRSPARKFDKASKNKTTFAQMIELDIFYTKHMSLSLDLWIMLRTFPALAVQLFEAKPKAKLVPRPSRQA